MHAPMQSKFIDLDYFIASTKILFQMVLPHSSIPEFIYASISVHLELSLVHSCKCLIVNKLFLSWAQGDIYPMVDKF